MNLVVINGSPKGAYSITLQSVRYLEKHYPQDTFTVFHVGQKIRRYAQEETMTACIEAMIKADVILFAYPVYTFLAPSQLAEFIELLKNHPKHKRISGKFVTQITTSKHFYDTTAQRFIAENGADIGLKGIPGLLADMDDLLTEKGQRQLEDFYKRVQFAVENDLYEKASVQAVQRPQFTYQSVLNDTEKCSGGDTVIVSDCTKDNVMLRGMIDAFKAVYPYPIREVNIAEFSFQGGCLGCFECAYDGHCIYKDGFEDLLRNEVLTADAFVFAATISNHSLGTRFKRYHDRQFCNGHRV